MAYEKNTWANGDVITAEKLNHMEGGIETASGVLVGTYNNGYLDITGNQVKNAMDAGIPVYFVVEDTEPNGYYKKDLCYYYEIHYGETPDTFEGAVFYAYSNSYQLDNGETMDDFLHIYWD